MKKILFWRFGSKIKRSIWGKGAVNLSQQEAARTKKITDFLKMRIP